MARWLKNGEPVVVVIRGGGHDLADDLAGCQLEKIVTNAYRAAVGR